MATGDNGSCLQKPSIIFTPATVQSEELNSLPKQEHRGSSQWPPSDLIHTLAVHRHHSVLHLFPLTKPELLRSRLMKKNNGGAIPSMHGKLGWLGPHKEGKHLVIGEGPFLCAARRVLSPVKCLSAARGRWHNPSRPWPVCK